jgi:Xaa-Pro aminopeptidase
MSTKVFNIGDYGRTISPVASIDFDKMLKDKLKRARDAMKKYNLGSVLCLTPPNIQYVTNIPLLSGAAYGIVGYAYALLPYEGTPIHFQDCDGAYHLKNLVKNIEVEYAIPAFGGPWVSSAPEAREYIANMFADQIYEKLKELRLDKEVVGIDSNMPHVIRALEKRGLKVDPIGGEALLEARMIKTPEEQQLIRLLAYILDGCFALMARIARPGVTEREIFKQVVAYAIEHGLTVDGGYICSGPSTWPKDTTRQCTDRRLRPGDVFYSDLFNFGCAGYRSCYYRTFSVGPAPKDVKETYERVITWLKEAEKVLRPGITTKEVVEKWPDERELWSKKPPYITDEKKLLSTFFNNMGHSIGLSIYEPPFFWRPTSLKWPQKLEAGMTIALETLDGTPDNRFGVRVEDMIIITETGYEVISGWPADEITELPLY